MIDRDVALLLIGVTLGVVSSFIGALVQHFLSLKADRIKRQRDRQEEEARRQRGEITREAQIIRAVGEAVHELARFENYMKAMDSRPHELAFASSKYEAATLEELVKLGQEMDWEEVDLAQRSFERLTLIRRLVQLEDKLRESDEPAE